MSDQTTLTERIQAHTLAIQSAREALQVQVTLETREALRQAEQTYRDYLMTLNGLPD